MGLPHGLPHGLPLCEIERSCLRASADAPVGGSAIFLPVFSTRRCAGFTLVELLVAATLFSVGMLALAGTSLAIARLERWSARDARAAATAESRLELLRAHPCSAQSARDSSRDITQQWTAFAPTNGVALLFDSVTIAGDNGWAARTETFRSTTPCN